MTIQCSNPKNAQEQSLCSCKQATDAMVGILRAYETLSTNYTSDLTNYNREKKRHDEWRNMSGEFASWATRKQQLIDERKNTRNWACEGASWDGRGGWCSNDHGGDWEFDHHSKDSWQVCSFTHKCRRKSDAINKILRDEGYNRAEPSVPGVPQSPVFKSENTIQCCSQIFNDINISGGPATFSNINQNCSQRINEQLNAPAPTSAPTSAPTLDKENEDGEEVDKADESNQTTIIIIIIIVLLLISSSSIGGVFFINKGE